MKQLRDTTLKCGYCGAYYLTGTFCTKCLDSEYLTLDNLPLLRLHPVSVTTARPELTPDEQATLLPLFHHAQLHGSTERGKQRIAKQLEDINRKHALATRNADNERDGALWVISHYPNLLGNHIYYSHAQTHCFGWRSPLIPTVKAALLEAMQKEPFPGKYEIK